MFRLRMTLIAVGFIGVAMQILGVYVATFFFPQGGRAVAVSMVARLSGLAFANYFAHKKTVASKISPENLFFLLFTAATYLTFPLYYFFEPIALQTIRTVQSAMSARDHSLTIAYICLCFLNLFTPSFFLGFLFPRANDWVLKQDPNKTTSWANFQDLLGAVLGAGVIGYYVLPEFGIRIAAISIFIAGALAALMWMRNKFVWIPALLIGALVSWFAIKNLQNNFIDIGDKTAEILFQRRSDYGVVTVVKRASPRFDRALFINYRSMCTSNGGFTEWRIGRDPISYIKRDNLRVLNIGLGCGGTAAAIAEWDKVAAVDVVEINKVVATAASTYFRDSNHAVLENPKVKLQIEDGFHYLNRPGPQYDSIIMDIEEPNVIQSTALFTADYFKTVKSRMPEDGVFAVWSFYSPRLNKVTYNTLKSVFPIVKMVVEDNYIIFVASSRDFNLAQGEYSLRMVGNILKEDTDQIATISDNPYPALFPKDAFPLGEGKNDSQVIRK